MAPPCTSSRSAPPVDHSFVARAPVHVASENRTTNIFPLNRLISPPTVSPPLTVGELRWKRRLTASRAAVEIGAAVDLEKGKLDLTVQNPKSQPFSSSSLRRSRHCSRYDLRLAPSKHLNILRLDPVKPEPLACRHRRKGKEKSKEKNIRGRRRASGSGLRRTGEQENCRGFLERRRRF